jgi:hypothetical protein
MFRPVCLGHRSYQVTESRDNQLFEANTIKGDLMKKQLEFELIWTPRIANILFVCKRHQNTSQNINQKYAIKNMRGCVNYEKR